MTGRLCTSTGCSKAGFAGLTFIESAVQDPVSVGRIRDCVRCLSWRATSTSTCTYEPHSKARVSTSREHLRNNSRMTNVHLCSMLKSWLCRTYSDLVSMARSRVSGTDCKSRHEHSSCEGRLYRRVTIKRTFEPQNGAGVSRTGSQKSPDNR